MSKAFNGLTAEQWGIKHEQLRLEHENVLRRIAEKQKRDRDSLTTSFAIVSEGRDLHVSEDIDFITKAAELYEDAEVVMWKQTARQTISFSKEEEIED